MNETQAVGHTVEKIGGTSMSDYEAVRDNIVLQPEMPGSVYQRVFVVSAYGGITNELLEHKKSGKPGIYSLFASGKNDDSWRLAMAQLREKLHVFNAKLFDHGADLSRANDFINERLDFAVQCLTDLQSLCRHGHFALSEHLETVQEMLASLGEAHSAWNTATLLKRDGVNARFVDLSGWQASQHVSLDERIVQAF